MIKKVFKYSLRFDDKITVNLPEGAEVLTAQTQYDHPCLWVLVDPAAKKEKRVFRLAGTGHPIAFDMGSNYKFIDSFHFKGGTVVFHLFEMLGV